MKWYVGVKMVQAEPMEKDGKEGYKVVYADGYESWSPKEVFEEAYHWVYSKEDGDEILESLKKLLTPTIVC